MTINLKSLCITNYDSKVEENVKFINEIKNNEKLNTGSLALEKSTGVNNLKLGIAYLVKDNENLIGLIHFVGKSSQEHTLDVNFITNSCTDKDYSEILSEELNEYVLNNSSLIKKINLDIKKK